MGSNNVLPLDPLPRPVRLLGTLMLVVLLAGVVVAGSWMALTLGWHPMPDTVIGCNLHMKFRSGKAQMEPQRIISRADCLNVKVDGRVVIVRDRQRITDLEAWFAAHDDRWIELPLVFTGGAGPVVLDIQACSSDKCYERIVANQDWIGMPVGEGFWRPICRDEWRLLIALAAH